MQLPDGEAHRVRLPVRVTCDELTVDDLFQVMKRSEGSIIRQYERAFRAYGIEVFLEDESLREIARRPEATVQMIAARFDREFDPGLIDRVMTEARYDGYIIRQRAEIKRQSHAEGQRIPSWLFDAPIDALRHEAVETLRKFRPATMGQANPQTSASNSPTQPIAAQRLGARRSSQNAAGNVAASVSQ